MLQTQTNIGSRSLCTSRKKKKKSHVETYPWVYYSKWQVTGYYLLVIDIDVYYSAAL